MSFLDYLWFYLVKRLGWGWWAATLFAFTLPFIVWYARGRRRNMIGCREVATGLLAGYVVLLFATTVFTRPTRATAAIDFGIFVKLRSMVSGRAPSPENIVNVLMLIPVGCLLPIATEWGVRPTLLTCFVLTAGVETMQFAFVRGWFELSDIVLNTLGAAVGYALCLLVRALAGYRVDTGTEPQHLRHS